jgi:hypothetical protein
MVRESQMAGQGQAKAKTQRALPRGQGACDAADLIPS